MEPCMYQNQICNCSSSPPTFNVPKPKWNFPTTTAVPPTNAPTSPEPTTTDLTTAVTNTVTTLVKTFAPTSTADVRTSHEPTEPSSTTPEFYSTTSSTTPADDDDPVEPGTFDPWLVIGPVLGIAALIGVIVIIHFWRKNNHEKDEVVIQPSLTKQNSTMGLVGADEPDGKGKTDFAENDTVRYENDVKLTPENDCLNTSKDGIGVDDKPAPLVEMTEL